MADRAEETLLSSTCLKSFGAYRTTLVKLGAACLKARAERGLVHVEMLDLQFRQDV